MSRKRNIALSFLFLSLFSILIQPASTAEAANGLPIGELESISCGTDGVVGFAFDEDVDPDSIPVHLYVDGSYAASINTNTYRSDVNTDHNISGTHGFVWTIPSEYKDGNSHLLTVYAINKGASSAGNPKIGSQSFVCKQPTVTIEGSGSFRERNGTRTLTARLSETYDEDTLIRLAFSGSAIWNIDFTSPNQILIPAGSAAASITLKGRDDKLKETTESILVDVSSVVNGIEDGVQQVSYSITDNDASQKNGLDITPASNNTDVQNIFNDTFVGPGVVASNFKQIGSANQFGTFSNGSEAIGASRVPLRDGVVFVTGDVTTASSANGNTKGNFSSRSDANTSDPDLVALSGSRIYDAAGFEFKFRSVTDRIGFVFSFASDEYPEYVGTIFNDAFGFFIEGGEEYPTQKNVAIVPGTDHGIAVNTINNGVPGQYASWYPAPSALDNSNFYISNSSAHSGDKSVGPYLEYDGLTTRLIVDAPISRETLYDIKIAIGDAGDANWDSAVFFETNGFLALTSATDNEYSVSKNSSIAGNFILDDTGNNVDIDPEDGTATLVLTQINDNNIGNGVITLPSGATLAIGADGAFTYDPSTSAAYSSLVAGQTAVDIFTYTIIDDIGITDTATITVNVIGKSATQISCDSTGYLFNTGFNAANGSKLSVGQLDANWEVGVGNAAGPITASQWRPAWVIGKRYGVWAESPFGNAEWIGFNSDGTHTGEKDYFYRYRFDLDAQVNPNDLALNLDFFADNTVIEIYVNGEPQSPFVSGVPQSNNGYYYQGYRDYNAATTTLNRNWKVGNNEIIIHTQTGHPGEGFLAQVGAQAICPPVVTMSGGEDIIETGGTGTVTLTLNKTVSYPVTVNLRYYGVATLDADFTSPTQVVIPAGELNATFDITAIEDAVVEGDEEVTIEIASIVNGVEDSIQTADFTIIDVLPVTVEAEGPAVLACAGRAPIRLITNSDVMLSGADATITYPTAFALDEPVSSLIARIRAAYGNQTEVTVDNNVISVSNMTIPSGKKSLNLFAKPIDLSVSGSYDFTIDILLPNATEPIRSVLQITLASSPDTDGDGIPDCLDEDDDNDGIIDAIECGVQAKLSLSNGGFEKPDLYGAQGSASQIWGSFPVIAASYFEDQVQGWNTTASDNRIEIWQSNFGGVRSYEGRQHAEINANRFATLYQDVATTPNSSMDWSFAHRGRAGYDTLRLEIGPPGGPYEVMGEFVTGRQYWETYNGDYRVPAGQEVTRFRYVAVDTAAGNISVGNFIDGVEFYVCALDSDQDGLLDKFDLDSDNDGITDLRESGQDADSIDQNEDGIRDDMDTASDLSKHDQDNNGVADSINDDGPRDLDNDIYYDYRDIDSDNDGIPDHVEAQPTLGYISPSNVVDSNGMPIYLNGVGFIPVDTDSDGAPDYIDKDSDDDSLSDMEENGIGVTPSGKDSDQDGLDDAFEGGDINDPSDRNDEIDTPSVDLPDNDGDVFSGGNVDYRDDAMSMTGSVWNDQNLNGIRENTEPMFPNTVVELYNSNDEILAAAFTNLAGEYIIDAKVSDMQIGYYIKFVRPTSYLFTLQNIGLDEFDSDPDPFTGNTNLLYYPDATIMDAGLFYEVLDHGDAPSSYGDSYTVAGLPYETLWIGGRSDVPDTETIINGVFKAVDGAIENIGNALEDLTNPSNENDDNEESSQQNGLSVVFNKSAGSVSAMIPTLFTKSGTELSASNQQDIVEKPENQADGDDNSGADDEEGVTFADSESEDEVVYYLEREYGIEVEVYNPSFNEAYLEGWIDFNGNGAFDNSEIIVSQRVQQNATASTIVDVVADVPTTAACGYTYARFRVSDQQKTEPYGYAGFGETEDHMLFIDCRTDLEVKATITPNDVVQLSEYVTFDVSVKNNGPNPARTTTFNFTYPADFEDTVKIPLNNWDCDFGDDAATCTKVGLPIDAEEEVFSFRGRVPGTYEADRVIGEITVANETPDLDASNNTVTYDIEVDKQWVTIAGAEYIDTVFLYARYSDALGSLTERSRDFLPGEIIINPINVPIDVAAGISVSSYPTVTTAYCADDIDKTGCDQQTDMITGTILINEYSFISMTIQSLSGDEYVPSIDSENIIASESPVPLAPDGSGRYADSNPDRCQDWVDALGGYCQAAYDVWEPWGDYGSGGLADLYAFSNVELTQLVFESPGGRSISCGAGVGQCIKFSEAKPGVYLIEGMLDIQYVFNDDEYLRLGEPTIRFDRQVPFSFYIQVVAPFTESE